MPLNAEVKGIVMVEKIKLLHKGSVKDIYSGESEGELIFKFSERYSVFDWGEMPDLLENKGKCLALMGGMFFRWLESSRSWKLWEPRQRLEKVEGEVLEGLRSKGLKHHYVGQLSNEPETMVVKKVDVPKLPESQGTYDYSFYHKGPTNSLVPLEVIFRFGVPEGSSLLKRVGDQDYLRVLGLKNAPKVGEWLARPILEFSTKLESTDRYLNYEEAQRLAGLSDYEFARLHAFTTLLAMRLSDLFAEAGISLWDGKFEFAFGELNKETNVRDFVLVDSIGPDELRLSYQENKLSKEFLRSFYRSSPWLKEVEAAKVKAKQEKTINWKTFVSSKPMALTENFKEAATGLYMGLASTLYQKFKSEVGDKDNFDTSFLQNAPDLKELSVLMEKVKGVQA